MRILAIGDVVGPNGVEFLQTHLNSFKRLKNIDFCIANGENSTYGNGIVRNAARELICAGVDVITMGNHTFDKADIISMFDEFPIIRPANYPSGTPGDGYILLEVGNFTVAVINLMGRVNMDAIDCPFQRVNHILKKIKNETNIIIVDFHAEATSEKLALGFHLDGKVSAVFGTHTHVQTADERILDGGTAYITDIGMTGPINSILGVKKEIIIDKFITKIHKKFELSVNPIQFNGVIFDIDENTGLAESIERVSFM